MEYTTLGNTGLKVSRLGFGCFTFVSVDQAVDLLEIARSYGCNFFDNAELYGKPTGNAESLFGEAYQILKQKDPMKWRRTELVLTTKIFWGPPHSYGSAGENELGKLFFIFIFLNILNAQLHRCFTKAYYGSNKWFIKKNKIGLF